MPYRRVSTSIPRIPVILFKAMITRRTRTHLRPNLTTRPVWQSAVVLVAAICAGCASSAPELKTGTITPPHLSAANTENCGRRTGRMQIRILELRSTSQPRTTSTLSRTLQGIVTPIFGGPKSVEPEAARAQRIQQLKQDNAALQAAGCPSFDIARELAVTETSHTPRPQ